MMPAFHPGSFILLSLPDSGSQATWRTRELSPAVARFIETCGALASNAHSAKA